jgi:hypothetical protein
MSESITIDIDARWKKWIRSPLFWVVATLQGVAFSFAPAFLYWSGHGGPLAAWVQWVSLASIYLVGWFYLLLGRSVIRQLSKR